MVDKLYSLKKLQTQQQLLQKQQILASIASIDEEIEATQKNISTTSVQTLGAISDFRVLAMHKNTMKSHILKLNQQKSHFLKEIEKFDKILVELNKETEQFKYIQDQIKKEKVKKILKVEEEAAAEFVQSNWKVN